MEPIEGSAGAPQNYVQISFLAFQNQVNAPAQSFPSPSRENSGVQSQQR